MLLNRINHYWLGLVLIALVIVILLSELLLRCFVPLSSIVDQNDVYPKVWYLENFESIRTRGKHPIRDSHPMLGWTHRPNLRQPNFSTNALGLRGKRDYGVHKPSGFKRIVVLGDSFSAGYGVGDNETYSAQLESLVADSEVLNLAVSGYGVDQAILRWELLGSRFEPDIVILGIFIPDFHRNTLNWRFDAPKPRFYVLHEELTLSKEDLPSMEEFESNKQQLSRELNSVLELPRVWIATKYLFDRFSRKIRDWREADETFIEKKLIIELLIERLAEDCARKKAELIVMIIPTEYTPYPDEDRIQSIISGASKKSGAGLIKLDRFLNTNSAERAISPVFDAETGHWSAAGHRLVALQIADYLKADKISD